VLLSARAVPDALPCVRCDFVEARRARAALQRGPSLARHAPALAATDRSPVTPPPRRPAAPPPRRPAAPPPRHPATPPPRRPAARVVATAAVSGCPRLTGARGCARRWKQSVRQVTESIEKDAAAAAAGQHAVTLRALLARRGRTLAPPLDDAAGEALRVWSEAGADGGFLWLQASPEAGRTFLGRGITRLHETTGSDS
jgi:hypothetical protein